MIDSIYDDVSISLCPGYRMITTVLRFQALLYAAVVFILLPTGFSEEPLLTPEQQEWLASIEPIRISYDPEFAPFETTGADGSYAGVAAEFLQLVMEELGAETQMVPPGIWSDTMEAAKNGDIDLLPCIGRTQGREGFLQFTDSYLQFARVLVTRTELDVLEGQEWTSLRVAVQEASSHHGYLKQHHADLNLKLYKTFEEAILSVAVGETDAVVGNLATVTHTIQKLSIPNVKIASQLGDDLFRLHMGVRKELQPLVPLLNRALSRISPAERGKILDAWIPLPREADPELRLTRNEREWLLAHPRIRVGWDPDWGPIEFAGDQSEPRGFSVDLLNQLETDLGVKFVFQPAQPWSQVLKDLEQGSIDMVSSIGPQIKDEMRVALSRTYLTSPVVLFARDGYPYVRQLSELRGIRMALPKNYTLSLWIKRDYPEIIPVEVASAEEGLQDVVSGDADVYAGSVMEGNFYLSRLGNPPVSIAGETDYEIKAHFGVKSDWQILAGILNKALEQVPEEQMLAMYRDWVWVDYYHGVDYMLALQVAGIGVLGILLFVSFNRRLKIEVTRRCAAEEEALNAHHSLEQSFLKLKQIQKQKENLNHMIVHDMRSPLTVICGSLEMAALALHQDESNAEKALSNLNLAQASAGEISRMVDALLDVGRFESGHMPLKLTLQDYRDTVTDRLDGFMLIAAQKNVAFSTVGPSLHLPHDRELLQRVIANLVSNALKACKSGDRIEIRWSVKNGTVQTEVEDTGRGIEEKDQEGIFEKFVQCDALGYASGSGVGLAFCRLAVEAHGGEIGVKSAPGKGSTFTFILPLRGTSGVGSG